jgi:acyl dehydratase
MIGYILPDLVLPPVDRATLALFAGASGDHNPVHIDIDAARRAGMPDVFGHGMLGMAWLGRTLTRAVPQSRVRSFAVRFRSMIHLGDTLTCRGRIVEILEENGERRSRLAVEAVNQSGETVIAGEAVVALG